MDEPIISGFIMLAGVIWFAAKAHRDEINGIQAQNRRRRREELERKELEAMTARMAEFWSMEDKYKSLRHRENQTVTVKGWFSERR